jgi:hypothetical protein
VSLAADGAIPDRDNGRGVGTSVKHLCRWLLLTLSRPYFRSGLPLITSRCVLDRQQGASLLPAANAPDSASGGTAAAQGKSTKSEDRLVLVGQENGHAQNVTRRCGC